MMLFFILSMTYKASGGWFPSEVLPKKLEGCRGGFHSKSHGKIPRVSDEGGRWRAGSIGRLTSKDLLRFGPSL